jgi:hypothetical protein
MEDAFPMELMRAIAMALFSAGCGITSLTHVLINGEHP